MPWKRMEVVDQRIEFVIQATYGDKPLSQLCQDYGISRPTGYRWLRRYEVFQDFRALQDRSRRPHESPHKTPRHLERTVLDLYQHWGWGAKKLQIALRKEGVFLPWITIHRILKRNGLTGIEPVAKPATHRFEQKKPNALWQMDFKGHYTNRRLDRCHPFTLLDDHSRFVVSLHALPSKHGDRVWACLVEAFEQYGLPDRILMDHGTPWYNTRYASPFSRLTVFLLKQNIRLCFSGLNHPQTQGKVERFHRTLGQEIRHRGQPQTLPSWKRLFKEIRYVYNYQRPHEALGFDVPASRYQPSPRKFVAKPKDWEYPRKSQVFKVSPYGTIQFLGQPYYVAHVMAGEHVGVRVLGNKLLIQFRNIYLKEIDLKTRRAILLPQHLDCNACPDNSGNA